MTHKSKAQHKMVDYVDKFNSYHSKPQIIYHLYIKSRENNSLVCSLKQIHLKSYKSKRLINDQNKNLASLCSLDLTSCASCPHPRPQPHEAPLFSSKTADLIFVKSFHLLSSLPEMFFLQNLLNIGYQFKYHFLRETFPDLTGVDSLA